jgi:hypothetical protein
VKKEHTAKLSGVYAGRSVATDNPDTVVVKGLVTDRRDRDRPILLELTSEGARDLAARLLIVADEAENSQ